MAKAQASTRNTKREPAQKPETPAKRPPGRPPKATTVPLPSVTGVRFPPEIIERVDAYVDLRNEELRGGGLTTNRNAMIVRLVRDALDVVAPITKTPEGGAS